MKKLKDQYMDHSITKNNKSKHRKIEKTKIKKCHSESSWFKRACVLFLSLAILLTADPGIAEVFVMAEEEGKVDCVITSFMPLPEESEEQVIALGTPLNKLQFPDYLDAVCTYRDYREESSDPGQENDDKTEEENPKPDKPGDDTQMPEQPDDKDQTPVDSESSEQIPDDSGAGEETPGLPNEGGQAPNNPDIGDQPTEDPDSGIQTPEQPEEGEQTPESPGEGEQMPESPKGSEQMPDPSSTGQTPGQSDLEEQALQQPLNHSALNEQVTFVDKMDNMISVVKDKLFALSDNVKIEENHVDIPENMSGSLADLPSAEIKTDLVSQDTPETITINPVTWECITDYDCETPGCYIFTPLLPDRFVLAEGVLLPEIAVIVIERDMEDEAKAKDAGDNETKTRTLMSATESVNSGTFGTGLTWKYDNGTLTISGNGAMPDFDTTSIPWDDFGSMIQKIEIGSGVTNIGGYAFFDYAALNSVSIPSSVTTIGTFAFHGCSKLSAITIPGSVTTIGASAFNGCSSLGNITIPSSVTTIGNLAFSGCSALTMVEIPSTVSSVSAYSFRNCQNLLLYYPASLSGTLGTTRNTKANISYAPVTGGTRLEITGIGSGVDAIHFPASVGGGTVYSANWDADICQLVSITHASYPDHNYADNSSVCAICGYEAAPEIKIDYINELLVGFDAGSTYLVDGEIYTFSTADAGGKASLTIDESWFGKVITIVKQKNGQITGEAQKLPIPARPAPPSKVEAKDAGPDGTDGQLVNVDSTMEYREYLDDDTSTAAWTSISGTTVNLPAGSYEVRIKAVEDKSFCSPGVTVEIGEYELEAEDMPQARIDFIHETLINLTANSVYRIGIRQGTTDSDITYDNITAATGGIIALDSAGDPSWFGQTLSIIKAGINNTSSDSVPQILPIPKRPSAPTGIGSVDATEKKNDGKLTGVSSKMEYRKTGDTTWKAISESTVSDLVPGEYEVRLKATSTQFASEITTRFIASVDMQKEPTPEAGINYIDETLTGLTAGSKYRINDTLVTARTGGIIDLEEEWFNTTIRIVKEGNKTTTTDSEEQLLKIPARPSAPVGVKAEDVTAEGAEDGRLTGVDNTMEYRDAEDDTWKSISKTEVNGLAPGIYTVCYKATAESFRSVGVDLTVRDYILKAEATPAARIDYLKETLIGLVSGASYQIEYDGASSGSIVLDAGSDKSIAIDEEWFGCTLYVIRLGDDIRTQDSEAQTIEIDERPDAPEGIVAVDISGTNAKSGKLENVKSTMEYQPEGSTKWTAVQGTVVSGLTSGAYLIRYKAVKDKSFCSESTRCTIIAYELMPEPTPEAEISFYDECLMYLTPGATYKVNSVKVQADDRGMIPIRAAWMNGKASSIIQIGDGLSTSDSEKQSITIPKRPAAPSSVKAVSESAKDANDGKLTGVKDTMEYRRTGSDEWIYISDTVVEDLEPAKYEIRYASTDQSFVSKAVTRIVYAFGVSPPKTEENQAESSEEEDSSKEQDNDQEQSSSQNGETAGGAKDKITPADQKKDENSLENETTDQEQSVSGKKADKNKNDPSHQKDTGDRDQMSDSQTQDSNDQAGKNSDSENLFSNVHMDGDTSDIGRHTQRFRLGDGQVTVTIENEDEALSKVTLADSASAVMAVLSKEDTDRVLQGEEAEILVSIKRIDDSVPLSDQKLIDREMEELQNKMPDPAICMYLDISVSIRIEDSGWRVAEEIEKPIDLVIYLPADLAGQYDTFYALHVHDGVCRLLDDIDKAADTITIQTHLFSTYAVLHSSGDTYVYTERMEKNMSVFFDFIQRLSDNGTLIWIAVILAEPILFLLLLIYVLNRKNRNKECQIEN